MKMSGTKPMKNTMRKPSPMKQTDATTLATTKAGVKKAMETKTTTATPRPTAPKKPGVKNPAVTPAMQLKKHKK